MILFSATAFLFDSFDDDEEEKEESEENNDCEEGRNKDSGNEEDGAKVDYNDIPQT